MNLCPKLFAPALLGDLRALQGSLKLGTAGKRWLSNARPRRGCCKSWGYDLSESKMEPSERSLAHAGGSWDWLSGAVHVSKVRHLEKVLFGHRSRCGWSVFRPGAWTKRFTHLVAQDKCACIITCGKPSPLAFVLQERSTYRWENLT